MSKVGLIGSVLLVAAVTCACGDTGAREDAALPAAATSSPAVAPAQAAVPGAASAASADTASGAGTSGVAGAAAVLGVGAETVRVTSITDGDTFRVGDRRIRVIGIDSCETGTTGGDAATAEARRLLTGVPVTLSREPGVDKDRYDREVRYVGTPSGDFGRLMVPGTHTNVYNGGNNASESYLSGLRALDRGRSCGASAAPERNTATQQPAPKLQAAPKTSAPTAQQAPRPVAAAPKPAPAPAPAPKPAPAPAPAPAAGGGGAYFKNCSAARAAGAAPLLRGQAGYRSALDRDNDGVACE
ncbi:thermonuclease family protein [Pseudonocardia nematodicida]|uniref:Thermonuclease family protein n=1 Tax=Pseudonocardia nematodicida TaxID=1206997 RepID=A0ABV1KIJ1_9PSEU